MEQLKVQGISSFTKFATNGKMLKLKDAIAGEQRISLQEATDIQVSMLDEDHSRFTIFGQSNPLVELTLPHHSCDVLHAWLLHKLKRQKIKLASNA
ncbi:MULTISPECIES: hypothetical protein [Exiguobacterium]|uniref:hypothetical protein n=1 Tax=Exiguobacterium TaxID=33986 RepID=UPI001BEA9399|nr:MULTISPECIES: hypothetical protein [Exiguobacterium]MCT4781883.1 hypothetical protein [Exiguobacterium himgiriensis]